MSTAARDRDRALAYLTCPGCARRNPAEASFCYHDGCRLPGHAGPAEAPAGRVQRFPHPFVFPAGRRCQSFEELALACQDNWEAARELLCEGALERFLGSMGRMDLARLAKQAAHFPDPDRGLDQFLEALPVEVLGPPLLRLEPPEVNLGVLRPGEVRHFPLRLRNAGQRLLYGSATCGDCDWLALGSAAGGADKRFSCTEEVVLEVHVRGPNLRARDKPLEAVLEIKSNGGTASVVVRAEVPVRPFPSGLLEGARSPRQLAQKIRATPREAAVFLENGAVAGWYRDNGWTYPIAGPAGSGLGAVQQFFEALGLARPPHVEVGPPAIALHGPAGARLQHALRVHTPEKRPVWAHASSDQPWLEVGAAQGDGATLTLPLLVAAVPRDGGGPLQARVKVTANGNQRFVVPVTLLVEPSVVAVVAAPAAVPLPSYLQGVAVPPPLPTPVAPVRKVRKERPWLIPLLPAALLALLLGIVIRDGVVQYLGPRASRDTLSNEPLLAFQFHEGKRGDPLDEQLPEATMRFGIRALAGGSDGTPRRLTADDCGRTNNVCLRLDGAERLFGSSPGRWVERAATEWTDARGVRHQGMKSVWLWEDKKIQATQFVELVRGEESNRLDTCLVRYVIENQDNRPHAVGVRFLLDTYIGSNDGVPFTIPGERDLCTDRKEFRKAIPAFIQALENEDLERPGTVAHLKLKLGDREPPSRVTLGAWPDDNLQTLLSIPQARGVQTLWDVPVRPMKTLFPYDSAVVMYWDDKPLPAGGQREVGFAYGLGSVSSNAKLLLTVDGSFKPRGELTVTALVNDPQPGEEVTLVVPAGFDVQGEATQAVPAAAEESASRNRPVTWKVKAGPLGEHTLEVRSSTGAAQNKAIRIKESSIFD